MMAYADLEDGVKQEERKVSKHELLSQRIGELVLIYEIVAGFRMGVATTLNDDFAPRIAAHLLPATDESRAPSAAANASGELDASADTRAKAFAGDSVSLAAERKVVAVEREDRAGETERNRESRETNGGWQQRHSSILAILGSEEEYTLGFDLRMAAVGHCVRSLLLAPLVTVPAQGKSGKRCSFWSRAACVWCQRASRKRLSRSCCW